ncbi:MAG: hypothetical protein WCR58_02450 [Bacteroidales bacterium]|jgi:hypothetical protein|nr:hypothetical protein [Bacteroidales bacterium]MDD3700694.1 hypothetical protein [Bacteroidales bacterium]MDY0370379.1 hypothetical protein [Bacteroidales bacterium]
MRSLFLWVLSFLLMGVLAVYQRTTGPTYPVSGKLEIQGQPITYNLLRSHDTGIDAPVSIEVPEGVSAIFSYKRFKSHDQWHHVDVSPVDGSLHFAIPQQPPAGKVEYKIVLREGESSYPLTDEPVIIRFKGVVPDFVLVPHIFFMFFAMVFGLRTGIEALLKRDQTYMLTSVTLLLLLIGGLIFGPIVQKYAFGAYWTGWPWGHDLTDNKTIAAFIFWLIAWLRLRKKPQNRIWPIVAMIAMLATYLIPHSALGSELDFTQLEDQATSIEQQL